MSGEPRPDAAVLSAGEPGFARRWFITGASSGLGRAVVEAALERGDRVVATVRRPDALADLQARHAAALEVEMLDVTDADATDRAITRVLARGPVHVVVNNAGYSITGAAEEMSEQQVQHQIETLLLAPMRITRRFLQPLRPQGGGHIVQISSVGGQVTYPAASAYHAGKWGLEGFTEALACEVADFGIRCTIVEPGSTRTGFMTGMRYTDPIPAYQQGSVTRMRDYIRNADDSVFTGDPRKLAAVISDTSRQMEPPLRLPLGADAHQAITAALQRRSDAIAPLRELAASIAFDQASLDEDTMEQRA